MEEVLVQLLKAIAQSQQIISQENNRHQLLKALNEKNEELYLSCSSFLTAWDAWTFSRKDMQLNIKAPDLFKIQKQMFLQNLNTKANELKVLAIKYNVDITPFLNALDFEYQ